MHIIGPDVLLLAALGGFNFFELGKGQIKRAIISDLVRLGPITGLLNRVDKVRLEAVVRTGVEPVAVPIVFLVPMRSLCVKQRATVRRTDQCPGNRCRLAYHRIEHVGIINHVQFIAGDPVPSRLWIWFRLGLIDRRYVNVEYLKASVIGLLHFGQHLHLVPLRILGVKNHLNEFAILQLNPIQSDHIHQLEVSILELSNRRLDQRPAKIALRIDRLDLTGIRFGIRLGIFLRLQLNVLRMLAAQVNQAVVIEDRLAEVPTIGVFVFAILTLFHREVDGRGQARLNGVPDIEAEQLPSGPAVTGPPDIPHQAIIDHRPSAPTPVPVPPGIGPEQFALAWPIGLELVAPTHLLVDQGQFTQHRQLRQIGQVDHRQENIGIGLFRFLLTIIIPFATFRDRLWRIGRLEILGLQQVQFFAVQRGA